MAGSFAQASESAARDGLDLLPGENPEPSPQALIANSAREIEPAPLEMGPGPRGRDQPQVQGESESLGQGQPDQQRSAQLVVPVTGGRFIAGNRSLAEIQGGLETRYILLPIATRISKYGFFDMDLRTAAGGVPRATAGGGQILHLSHNKVVRPAQV